MKANGNTAHGDLQLATVQTALEFFSPGEWFTIKDIHSLLETGIAEGNPLEIRLTVNAPSQIAGVFRLWNRKAFSLKAVKKMVGRRRLEIVDEQARPLTYYWTGPEAKPAEIAPVAEIPKPEIHTASPKPWPTNPEIIFAEDEHMLIRIEGKLWSAKPFTWERG